MRAISRFFKKLYRSLQFAKKGWNSYDWDHWHLTDLMLFKMKRMHKALKGGMDREGQALKSLRIAIKLLERIQEDKYGGSLHKKHDAKWGESEFNFTPCEDLSGCSQLHVGRDRVVTEEDKEQERKEFLEIINKSYALRRQSMSKFFKLLEKYHEYWWE